MSLAIDTPSCTTEDLTVGIRAIGAAEFELAYALRRFAEADRADLVAKVRELFDETAALRLRLGLDGAAERQPTGARAWAYANGLADGTLLTLDLILDGGSEDFPQAVGYAGEVPDELRDFLLDVRQRAESAAAVRRAGA